MKNCVRTYWEPVAGSTLKLFPGLPSSGVKVTLREGNVLPQGDTQPRWQSKGNGEGSQKKLVIIDSDLLKT